MGNTLYHIVKYIDANNKKNIPITVVPIMGASNVKRPERDAMDLAKDLASAYGGTYQYIYAPLFVKNRELKEELVSYLEPYYNAGLDAVIVQDMVVFPF